MNEQRLGPLIESWLKGSDSPPGDIGRSTAQIESRLPQTRQRSRWWPLLPIERLYAPVAGHAPAGGSLMFSALKFVAAGAIVALVGGFLLSGVLTTPNADEVAPAAVSASPTAGSRDAVIVGGRSVGGTQTGLARVTYDGDTTRSVGAQWLMELTEMDDPRLNGTFQVIWNETTYDGIHNVITASSRIDNDHGSWVGVERGYEHPTLGWNTMALYEGQGAYEGLSALLFWVREQRPGSVAHGIVFPGEMPEPLDAPEPASE